MLIDLAKLHDKYRMTITGILHVGAHLGEEAELYLRLQIPHVWWVEANPQVQRKLSKHIAGYPHQDVIEALVTDIDGDRRRFNVTNYDGMSSSVFPFGDHPKYSPDTVYTHHETLVTTTIDNLTAYYGVTANFLNLDIQGAELLALRGATRFLKSVEYLYTEVSTGPVYLGGAQMHEIDDLLAPEFSRVETDLGMHGGSHGDALYIRS